MQERTVRLTHPVDVHMTWYGLRRGRHDPTCRTDSNGIWRTSRAPGGPSTLRLVPDGDRVQATAWGDGAEAMLDQVPALIGADDTADDFEPDHRLVQRLWRDFADVRIPRSGAVVEALVANVLEQRVTTYEARRAQAQIVRKWGEPAPGPTDLLLPVDPDVLAGVPYYDLHVCGVERHRADTVRRVAGSASRLDALRDQPIEAATERLLAVPGVGPWTTALTVTLALGAADAVPVGDAHLPADVTWALTGEAVDDDQAMLDALAEFPGHRGRVIRLIGAAGIRAPRTSPRYAPRDIRRD
jgi:3-methyladenine DNA glycosylase/8-oxoguanine DNA glycosylase